jgi:hypothetical protein
MSWAVPGARVVGVAWAVALCINLDNDVSL